MQRHNEAWRDSLRYRRPDLDRMSGIRRITANNNPMLGDDGAKLLADALKDDLWLKALDLQSCGVGVSGAKTFLEVLKYNTTLVVLDLRRNPLIGRDMLHSVMEQLMLNSNGQDGEYKWMTATEPDTEAVKSPLKPPVKPRRRATKVLNGSVGRKTTIKVTPMAARGKLRNGGVARKFEVQPSPGFPWRTAARANRFRGHPPDRSRFLSSPDVSTSLLFTNTNKNNDGGSGSDREAVVVKSGPSPGKHTEPDSGLSLKTLEESHMSLDLTNQKEVLIELEQMRRRLREERLARAKADQQIVQLMLENHRLEGMLEKLEKGRSPSRRILEDEKFLESIETSFKQFHAFIDMLKEAGLGQLVSMAGLDQSRMPFGNSSAVKNHYENLPEPGTVHISRLTSDGHVQTSGQRTGMATSVPPHHGSNVYSDEGELARQEADELYTKLVRETQSAIKDTAPRDTTWMRSSAVTKNGGGGGGSEPGDAHFHNQAGQGVDSRQEHLGQSRIDESVNFSVGESRDNESANLSVEQSSYGGEGRHSGVDKDDSADDEDF